MTPFEFVFALISVITSLALTKTITGVIAIIRHKERGSFSLTHALWVWVAFAVVVGNWGAMWGVRTDTAWPPLRVLAWLTAMASLYTFCALVIPEVDRATPLDLKQFHAREGRRYMIAHNVFAALAVVFILALVGLTADSIRTLVAPSVAFALGTVALLTRGRPQLVASILLAILATMFMVDSMHIVSTGAQH